MLDQERLFKPIRKIRKALKGLPRVPSPEQVHGLRTQTRRLEAIVHALKFDETKHGRRLLRSLTPIRKAAGKVRDMDVLTGLASSISQEGTTPGEDQVRLLEELGERRFRLAGRLHKAITGGREHTLHRLRRFSVRIDEWIENTQTPGPAIGPGRAAPAAVAMSLPGEFSAWTRLGRNNLHPYRIKIKELRYMLELAQSRDNHLLKTLGQTKDAIGEWHDWRELEDMAREILGKGNTVRQIRAVTARKFEDALKLATGLQKRYFEAGNGRRAKQPGAMPLKMPVLITAARMSA